MEWSEVLDNPLLRDLPFKIELNKFGKLLRSPASNEHGRIQSRLAAALLNQLSKVKLLQSVLCRHQMELRWLMLHGYLKNLLKSLVLLPLTQNA